MRRGFTIVELLIVIVVIAILAAISVVAYNGIQQRARDNIRKQDLAQLAKALKLYSVDNGNHVSTGSGCGNGGNGEGWVSTPTYTKSIVACLMDGKYIDKNIVDPSGCVSNTTFPNCQQPTTTAYMKLNCSSGGSEYAYLLARTESEAVAKPAELTSCPNHSWWEFYGMNYAVRVD